jgi:hypothetical protein
MFSREAENVLAPWVLPRARSIVFGLRVAGGWFPVGYQKPTGTKWKFLTVFYITDGCSKTDSNKIAVPDGFIQPTGVIRSS